jgi:hypothetical protein
MSRSGPPICVPCAVEMRCLKNGFVVADPEPSTYWRGDLYRCPQCKRHVVTGFGEPFTDERLLPPAGPHLRFRRS